MPEKFIVQVGDWVRFQQGGRLAIGEVRYMHHNGSGYAYVVTDVGTVAQTDVLETRLPTPGKESSR